MIKDPIFGYFVVLSDSTIGTADWSIFIVAEYDIFSRGSAPDSLS